MSTPNLPQIDPAMLELFQSEMDTHIPVLNAGLLALEKGQAGAAEIEAMMRAAHSIKGAARIVGIEPAVRVSHVMEDCFTAAKDKRITLSSDAVDVLLHGVDTLQRVCSPAADAPVGEASVRELVDRLTQVKSGQLPAPSTATTTAAPPPEPVTAEVASGLVAATVRPAEPSVTLPAVFDQQAAASLRNELLDTLRLAPARVQLDFAQVQQLTAEALALLASFVREASRSRQPNAQPAIESRGLSPAVRKVMRAAGLDVSLGVDR